MIDVSPQPLLYSYRRLIYYHWSARSYHSSEYLINYAHGHTEIRSAARFE